LIHFYKRWVTSLDSGKPGPPDSQKDSTRPWIEDGVSDSLSLDCIKYSFHLVM